MPGEYNKRNIKIINSDFLVSGRLQMQKKRSERKENIKFINFEII